MIMQVKRRTTGRGGSREEMYKGGEEVSIEERGELKRRRRRRASI